MLKKFGWGAGVALLSAAAIAGCGSKSKGSTIINSGGGDLSNQDQVPFSSIAQNNLAIDGNAFSNNGQSFQNLKVVFNNVAIVSSGSTGGDGSAMVVFSTTDNNTTGFNNVQRIWASHFDGNGFTPPVELDGEDRDSTITGGNARQTVVANVLMCPLNVKNYKDASGQPLQVVSDNDGNWVIVWDANTSFQTPINSDKQLGPRQAAPADGPHKALYYTLFVKSLRTKSVASSTILGGSGATAGAARDYRYGFLHRALEIEALQGGTSALDNVVTTTNGNAGTCRQARPAEDVIGYMFATDTIQGAASNASIDGAGNEPYPIDNGNQEGGLLQQVKLGPNTTLTGTMATPTGAGTALPSSATYRMGDDTTFLRLFYTQIASSRSGSTYTAGTNGNGNNSQQGGQRYTLQSAAFKLDTLTFETTAEFTAYPAKRATSGTQPWSVQPLPNLRVYNQHVFVRYCDASMSSEDGAGAGALGFQLNVGEFSQAMAVLTIANNGAGTNTITTANAHDITLLGAAGKHAIVNTAVTLSGPNGKNAHGSTEGVDFTSGALGDRANQSIYGADEGLEDTTAFVIVQADTIDVSGATNATTEELRLVSAGIKADGTILTGSPKIVSTHAAQKTGNTAGSLFTGDNNSGAQPSNSKAQSLRQLVADSVLDFGTRMSRDGTYVMCAFRQFDGTTLGATLLLNAVAYRTARIGGSVATAFDQRFSAVKKLSTASVAQTESIRTDISTSGAGSLQETRGTGAGQRTIFSAAQGPGENVGDFSRLLDGALGNNTGTLKSTTVPMILAFMPVNKFFFQGGLGYACGYQSDVTKMSVFWVCQDGTDDRVWGGTITTTIPAAAGAPTLASTEAEFEASASVSGPGVPNMGAASGPQNVANFSVVKSSFRFIPFSVQNSDFATTDAGVTNAGVGGQVLVNFTKIVDGTTSDGTFFNQEVISVLFDGTTTSSRVVLSRKFHENAQIANQYGGVYAGGVSKLIDTGTFEGSFRTNNVSVVSTPNNPDFANKPSYGPEAVHVIFNAPTGDTNNSAAGLWTRGWDAKARSQTTFAGAVPADVFFPVAAATAAANVDPVRNDRNLGTNANNDGTLQKTTTVALFIRGDGHEWVSLFENGKWSQDSNGAPTPGLYDNDSSQNVVNVFINAPVDKNCDTLSKSLVGYTKQDAQGNGTDIRYRQRVGN